MPHLFEGLQCGLRWALLLGKLLHEGQALSPPCLRMRASSVCMCASACVCAHVRVLCNSSCFVATRMHRVWPRPAKAALDSKGLSQDTCTALALFRTLWVPAAKGWCIA